MNYFDLACTVPLVRLFGKLTAHQGRSLSQELVLSLSKGGVKV